MNFIWGAQKNNAKKNNTELTDDLHLRLEALLLEGTLRLLEGSGVVTVRLPHLGKRLNETKTTLQSSIRDLHI